MAIKSHLLQEDISFYNPYLDGSTFTNTTLQAAITAIGSTRKTLFLPTGTWTLAASITTPTTLDLLVPAGALFIINPGVVLTLNGGFTAPLVPVFSGTGTVVFGTRIDTVHPQWWGALFDGTTDDRLPIQAALTTGKRVLLPPATAMLGASLVMPSGSTLEGGGPTSVIKAITNFGNLPLVTNASNPATDAARDSHLRIAHLTLDGNKANNGTGGNNAGCVLWSSVVNATMEGVTCLNAKGRGIFVTSGSTAAVVPDWVTIDHCRIVTPGYHGITIAAGENIQLTHNHIAASGGHGIEVINTTTGGLLTDVLVSQNHIIGCGTLAGANQFGIAVYGIFPETVYDVTVSENVIEQMTGSGIGFANTDMLLIRGNLLRNITEYGIYNNVAGGFLARVTIDGNTLLLITNTAILYQSTVGTNITNNTIETTTGHGMQLDNMERGVVSGNRILAATFHGIVATTVFRSLVTSNDICNCGGWGILLTTTADITITGNVVDGNTAGGIGEGAGSNFNIITSNAVRHNVGTAIVVTGAQTLNDLNQT